MKLRIAWLSILFLMLALVPASGQVIYSNGMCSVSSGGCITDAWQLNQGFVVSDSFVPTRSDMNGFDFIVWATPGDIIGPVDWSVTSDEFGGTLYGSGTAVATLTLDQGGNILGYDIQNYHVATGDIALTIGNTYWLNLQNTVTAEGAAVYWDENSGPSSASGGAFGTIPSESFDITGSYCSWCGGTPEPGSILLFGSGVLVLAGVLRRRLF